MKNAAKKMAYLTVLILTSATIFAQSQNESKPIIPKATAITETPIAPPVGKDVVITLKNGSEIPIAIFAGPREGIREPKITTYGGLSSNNKLYIHENDVVCLMTVDKRPLACASVKAGVTVVEVNSSANGISAK